MNQHETFVLPRAQQRGFRSAVKDKIPALAGMASVGLAYLFGPGLFSDLHNIPLTVLLFLWLFGTMMSCAFSAVRHATAIADRLGEPYGTLVLTLSVVVIEVSLLAAIMLHGREQPDAGPRRHVRHADDRAERHGRRGAADGRACAIGSRNTIWRARAPFSWSSPRSPCSR